MSFPNTRWTLIQQLTSCEGTLRADALSVLCRDYWRPVYSFLRRSGKGHEDAEDTCQGFFAMLLRAEVFAQAEVRRGQLRTFLLGTLEHFLANEYRMETALKRGGGERILSLDDPEACRALEGLAADCASPAEAFDGAWLGQLMERAVQGIRQQYEARGKGRLFAVLFPALVDQAQVPQEVLAEAGLSVSHFRVHLHRLRARYRRVLLEELAGTLAEGEDAEEELGWLFLISQRGV